jgi:hypothetical protein
LVRDHLHFRDSLSGWLKTFTRSAVVVVVETVDREVV